MFECSLDRRRLLAGTFAAGAAAILGGAAAAMQQKGFFERTGRPIGLQLYTLGDEAGRDLDATLAQVAYFGYRDIELPGLYGKSARDIRVAADRAGLRISSVHMPVSPMSQVPGLSFSNPASEIADTLGALGATYAVAPSPLFPASFRPQAGEDFRITIARAIAAGGEDSWKKTAATLNERAAALKSPGLKVGYHNHNIEFAPIGKTTGWEILMREFDPQLIGLEIDTGWVATAGLEPAQFIKKYKGRVVQLHVKEVAASNKTNFAFAMEPAEVGSGTLDWKRIFMAADEAGVKHFYVEQEPPFTIPRMEAVRRSYEFLSRLQV